jgi:hypothetical protein
MKALVQHHILLDMVTEFEVLRLDGETFCKGILAATEIPQGRQPSRSNLDIPFSLPKDLEDMKFALKQGLTSWRFPSSKKLQISKCARYYAQ